MFKTLLIVIASHLAIISVSSAQSSQSPPSIRSGFNPAFQSALSVISQSLAPSIYGEECVAQLKPTLEKFNASSRQEAVAIIMCRCWATNCPNATAADEDRRCRIQMEQYDKSVAKEQAHYTIFTTIYALVFVVGFIGNILVLLVLVLYPPVRKPRDAFLMSLTVSNLAMITICLPIRATSYVHWLSTPTWACYIMAFIYRLIFASSVFMMCTVGFERFLAICTQINIRAHSTAIKARIAVICVWIIAAIASIPSYVLVVSTVRCSGETSCLFDTPSYDTYWFYCYWFVAIFVFPLAILCVVYALICRTIFTKLHYQATARASDNSTEKEQKQTENNDQAVGIKTAERKQAIIMIIVVMIVFVCCWGPLLIANMLTYSSVILVSADINRKMNSTLYLLTFLNPCIDPFVYGIFSQKFRLGYKMLLCRCQQTKQEKQSEQVTSQKTATMSTHVI